MNKKMRDGFDGQKLISLPSMIYRDAESNSLILNEVFITHIGYFPKAAFHFRERRNGCIDNILIYCVQGKGWYMIDEKRYEVGPNQFFHIPVTSKYIKYVADIESPWSIYWVHFSGRDLNNFNHVLNISVTDGPQNIHYNEKGIQLWQNMFECLAMGYSRQNLNRANMYLYHFLATFLYPEKTEQNGEKDIIKETVIFMRGQLSSRFTVEDFAKRYKLSASHFSCLFRQATGTSPMDYFILLKIQQACQLLYGTQIKIREIAQGLGYDDAYYFSRLFKKLMGMSPEEYRAFKKSGPENKSA